jgi:hypothetical protein
MEGVQEIQTKKYGTVKISGKSFMDGGLHIGICPNGSYRHINGREVKDKKELLLAIPAGPDRDAALNWWDNRAQWEENAPREIKFERGTGYPQYADTEQYVEDYDELYNYFPPSPILTAAIQALGNRLREKAGEPKPKQAAPKAPPVTAKEVAKKRAEKQAAAKPPVKQEKAEAAAG